MPPTTSFQFLRGLSPAARSKLSLSLFFIGLAISIASCAGYSINYLPSTYQFGLLQALSPIFWLGFALCLLSLLEGINRDKEKVFFIKSLLLSMLIWNIPTLLLAHPYSQDAYSHILEAMPIMLSGHVPAISDTLPRAFTYYPAEFPGFHILLTSMLQITNVPATLFAKFYPLFSSLVTFLAIWLFFKTFLPSRNYRWALLISVLANVYVRFHVSPQSVGLIALILILVALEKPGLRWKSIAILLFAFVVVSHPTTAFILLPIIVLAWVLRIALRRDIRALASLAPVFVAIWLVWMLVYAASLGQTMIGLAAAAGGATEVTGIFFLERLIGVAGERFETIFYYGPQIRFAVLALFGLGSVYYLATQWLSRAGRKDSNLAIYTAFIIAPVVMTLLDVTLLKAGMLYDRYFLFFLLASPILLVRLAQDIGRPSWTNPTRKGLASRLAAQLNEVKARMHLPSAQTALLGTLVFLALFNFSTIYCYSPLFITSDETVSASQFINSKTSGRVMGGMLIPSVADPYRSAVLRQSRLRHLYPEPLSSLEWPTVIVFDDHVNLRYQAWYGVEKYDFYANEVEIEENFGKVYCNDRYSIYWFQGGGG